MLLLFSKSHRLLIFLCRPFLFFSQKRRCIIQCVKYKAHCIIHLRWGDDSHIVASHYVRFILPLVLIFIFNSLFELILVYRNTGLSATFRKVKPWNRWDRCNRSYCCGHGRLLDNRQSCSNCPHERHKDSPN